MKNLGEKIRELREAKDMSLREFARQLGDLSAAFVSDVELGRRFPSNKVLAKMATILDVKADELMKFDTRPPVDELKRLAASNPTYGVLLRTIAEKNIDPQAVTNFINKSAEKKKK
jgi:transcriptional regulator with XRE-family HTH domain